MKVVYNEAQKLHYPQHFVASGTITANPEQPERADRLFAAAVGIGLEHEMTVDQGLAGISAVHTPEYLQFLQHAHERWRRREGASAEVIPNVHPVRSTSGYPESVDGQAGFHMADTACPISAETWDAVRMSASTAVQAARHVLDGESSIYSLCRPPGHHAYADMAGGFCYLNNSGVAAQCLRGDHDRVAILDVDLHHGNGTQGMFYRRPDVLTVSLHCDPARFYPFFWGYADERGEGPGLGYNMNLPLPRHAGDAEFLEALDAAIGRIAAYSPGALVVALGLDAYEGDPFGGLSVTTTGFARIAEKIAALRLPTVIVQEGGYLCDELGANLASFLTGFGEKHRV
ncbi:histone deacetylase family protein [Microbaculum marinum]|uniref:Histone deacetylase family protein n=1 Tax=Microbaculum marinum TaxID=1764581 RepID=A0AAW9RCN0_9HYPH